MHAAFAIADPPGSLLDEDAALAAARAHRPLGEESVLAGQVTLTEGGVPPLRMDDDLQFLIPNLCLRATAALAAGDVATVQMASWPQHYALRRDGDALRVLEGDDEAEVGRFPYGAALKTLRGCAERFTAFVGELAASQPEWQPLHALLRRELAGATAEASP